MTLLHEYIQTDTLPSGEAGLSWFSGLVVYATFCAVYMSFFACNNARALEELEHIESALMLG